VFWGQGDQVNRCVLGHGNVIVCDSLKSVFWGQGDQVNRCVLGHGNVIVCDSLKSVFCGQGDQVNRCVLGHGNVIVCDSLKRRCEPVQQLANMSIHAANSCTARFLRNKI
jgi:hypothetical protein